MLSFGPFGKSAVHPLSSSWPPDATELLVAAAFASEAGVRALSDLAPLAEPGLRKRWLIGLENGLTQPEALRVLAELDDSEVRVPFGRELIESTSLRGKRFFHPKVYAARSPAGLVVVSASGNLTRGGLLENVEQFLAWRSDPGDPVEAEFSSWWSRRWRSADPVDAALIEAYAEVRPKLRARESSGETEATDSLVEQEPAPTDLAGASWLWIEATGPLEGGSNNQLELMLDAHHFFYPDGEPARDEKRSLIFVDAAGATYENPDRVIHYNGPPLMPKGNSMWRIRLPTAREGLSGYQEGGVAVRFGRTAVADRYTVEFATIGSPEAEAWIRESLKCAEVPGPPPRRMGWR